MTETSITRLWQAKYLTRKPSGAGRAATAAWALTVLLLSACATAPEPPPPERVITAEERARLDEALDLGEEALAQERIGDAQRLIERVIVRDPENSRARLLLAEVQLASGKSGQAANSFSALVDQPEIRARALQGKGIATLLIGDETIGEESLRLAVEADPSLWRAWNAIGFLEDSRQNWSAAVAAYDRALTSKDDSAIIYNNRGYSMIMQGRVAEAQRDLNEALRLDPALEIARENLRLAYAWEGRYIHALSGVADPSLPRVLNNVGYIALLRGDYVNAEAYLERAMQTDPRYNAAAARNLAYLRDLKRLNEGETPPPPPPQ